MSSLRNISDRNPHHLTNYFTLKAIACWLCVGPKLAIGLVIPKVPQGKKLCLSYCTKNLSKGYPNRSTFADVFQGWTGVQETSTLLTKVEDKWSKLSNLLKELSFYH